MRVSVARSADVAPGGLLGVVVDDIPLCVVHAEDGEFYAIDGDCSHESCPLSEGELDGYEVECPCHGSRFDVRTGEVLNLPALLPVTTYSVDIVDDDVVVTIP